MSLLNQGEGQGPRGSFPGTRQLGCSGVPLDRGHFTGTQAHTLLHPQSFTAPAYFPTALGDSSSVSLPRTTGPQCCCSRRR